ncbi:unnamed protein product [Brassicogethes aeneus]|uniref:DUF4371 domain-containing protein n=1 Tax=Brassicogethes aeneus TaxID=1431903 RepID=A0A9P0FEF7_BRAAE|nr:unnamed protein product [Brassicogethes aeneus]
MSSDSDDSTTSKVCPSKKLKSGHKKQKFRREWLKNPDYQAWLRPVEDNYKAKCVLCSKEFVSELSNVKKHLTSNNHKKLSNIKQSTSSLYNFASSSNSTTDDVNVKEAEIMLSAFFAEHNISFRVMDHLTPLLQKMFPDSKIAIKLALKRTKTKNIITNVIGDSYKDNLTNILKQRKFSVLIDESTDIAVTKTACIVVKYFDPNENRVCTSLWEYIPTFEENKDSRGQGTAEHLYNLVINTFVQRKVPLCNIVGFASDGCNMMMGRYNSVASRFREQCPGIVIFKCICHSLHICCSQACKNLPRTCEDLARNVYTFFNASSKRQFEYKEFQKFAEVEIHKILHPSQTRWLSLGQVVTRILEQWPALQLFFNKKYLEERLLAAEQIHSSLNDPFIKMYSFESIDETRLKCCKEELTSKLPPPGQSVQELAVLKQENMCLRKLLEKSERECKLLNSNNKLLCENKALLEEKLVSLQSKSIGIDINQIKKPERKTSTSAIAQQMPPTSTLINKNK